MANDFKLRSAVVANGKTANYAKLVNSNEPEFFVGFNTHYNGTTGIYNIQKTPNLLYVSNNYVGEYGFWANFISPTSNAESNNSFICLNTYDRAYFTFGFMQFAAHVPNGDFVRFFKVLLQLPNAPQYFPRLLLKDNRIFYRSAQGTLTQLESDLTTQPLMEYLNPTINDVENQEIICAARMVHWATNDTQVNAFQVAHTISMYKENMINYQRRLSLDGYPAKVCFMICDILHQGRGRFDRIAYAIDTNKDYKKAYSNLCTIGQVNYQNRINSLKVAINKLTSDGIFNKVYQASNNIFV
jgi:hypothetical protein